MLPNNDQFNKNLRFRKLRDVIWKTIINPFLGRYLARIINGKKLLEKYSTHKRILDVGCGYNGLDHHCRIRSSLLVGVDNSEVVVKASYRRYPDITFVVADARKLPFKDRSFDVSFYGAVLHHIPNNGEALKEAQRVSWLTFIHDYVANNNRLLRMFQNLWLGITDGSSASYGLEGWRKIVHNCGGEILEERLSKPLHHLYVCVIRWK